MGGEVVEVVKEEVWGNKNRRDLATDNPGERRDLNSHEVPQTEILLPLGKSEEIRGCELRGARESWRRGSGERYSTDYALKVTPSKNKPSNRQNDIEKINVQSRGLCAGEIKGRFDPKKV